MSGQKDSSSMLAGPGLLRSGTTLSINPNLKLITLSVRDRVVVPDPVEFNEATNRKYVDQAISSNGTMPGIGLRLTDDKQLTLADDISVNSITLTGQLGSDGSSVVTKAYVDSAISPLCLRSYVDDNITGMAKLDDVQTALEPYATRTYVGSFAAGYVSITDLNTACAPLAKMDDMKLLLDKKADAAYVLDAFSRCAKTSDVNDLFAPYVKQSYVDNIIAPFATQDSVVRQISSSADLVNSNISVKIQEALIPLATRSYVDEVARNAFSTQYVDEKIEPLALKSQVAAMVANLAEESYVDEQVAPLVTKDQLDDSMDMISSKVSQYVDDTIASKQFPITYPVQYLKPESGDTLESDGKTLLIVDGADDLSQLTIRFPSDVEDGKYFIINSSIDVQTVIYENLVTAGKISSENTNLVAGVPKKWVFSSEADAWFSM